MRTAGMASEVIERCVAAAVDEARARLRAGGLAAAGEALLILTGVPAEAIWRVTEELDEPTFARLLVEPSGERLPAIELLYRKSIRPTRKVRLLGALVKARLESHLDAATAKGGLRLQDVELLATILDDALERIGEMLRDAA